MSASVLNFSMSLDGRSRVRTTNPATPAATASTGCTSGTSLRRGVLPPSGPAGQLIDEVNGSVPLTDGVPRSRPTTGVVTFTAPRSS